MKSNREIEAIAKAKEPFKRQCDNCGHKIPIPNKVDRLICNWCGHWIYRTPELKFKYELRKRLKKVNPEQEAINQDRYQDDIGDVKSVPYHSYQELKDKYERVKEEYETFKEDIFGYISNNETSKAMEYCKEKGIW